MLFRSAVRNALKYAIEHKKDYRTEMQAITYGLGMQDSPAAAGAYNHLCDILEGNIFRRSEKQFQEGKLNVVSLKGINPKTHCRNSPCRNMEEDANERRRQKTVDARP